MTNDAPEECVEPMNITEYYRKFKLRAAVKDLRKSAVYSLECDGDILPEKSVSALNRILAESKTVSKDDSAAMESFLKKYIPEFDRTQLLSGFKRNVRNTLDVLAVAFAVAFGLRALYFQPFQIPTSSMQPTLFGVHYVDRAGLGKFNSPVTVKAMSASGDRAELTVRHSGSLDYGYTEKRLGLFGVQTGISIGGTQYFLPGRINDVARYIDLAKDDYEKDERLCDGWLSGGDHLFVERFTIHFSGLKRGEIAVFNTENIVSPTQPIGGYFYIKRVAGLPGDTLRIDGRMLMIKPEGETEFRPCTEFSGNFKKINSMKGGYQGHIPDGLLASGSELVVPEGHYFMLGDNTSNSLDGRNWGFVPRRNIVGRAFLVFWPLSRRVGIADTLPPLDVPTTLPYAMQIQ